MHLNDGKTIWHFSNTYFSYVHKGEVYYLLENHWKEGDFRYEVVRNRSYYGTNTVRKQISYYTDYRFQNRDPMDGNDSGCVFNQSDSFRTFLRGKEHQITLLSLDSVYIVELSDTVVYKSNLPGIHGRDKVTRYYISKKDGRITKCICRITSEINGRVTRTDSIVYTYHYFKPSTRQVREKIDRFRPLSGFDEEAFKKRSLDSAETSFRQRKIFPGFSLPDTSAQVHRSGDIAARYVMLDFWYKSCGPCLANMENIERIRQTFTKKDLEILAVNVMDSLSTDLKILIRKFNTSFIWLMKGAELNKALHVYAYPTLLIYDNRTGEIVYRSIGSGKQHTEEITEFIKRLLSAK